MPTMRSLLMLGLLSAAGLAVAQTAPKADAPGKPAAQPQAEQVRDWNKVDTNRDGLVSPEEMEKYLAENPGPLKR